MRVVALEEHVSFPDLPDAEQGPALARDCNDALAQRIAAHPNRFDYPFSANEQGRAFLNSINLPPTDVEKIAHGNADRLLKLRA